MQQRSLTPGGFGAATPIILPIGLFKQPPSLQTNAPEILILRAVRDLNMLNAWVKGMARCYWWSPSVKWDYRFRACSKWYRPICVCRTREKRLVSPRFSQTVSPCFPPPPFLFPPSDGTDFTILHPSFYESRYQLSMHNSHNLVCDTSPLKP